MTFAKQLENRGLQQGLQQGERQKALVIARAMLSEKLDSTLIKKVRGLSDIDLLALE